MDEFEWADLVRWHCQAQRINREFNEGRMVQAQMAQVAALAQEDVDAPQIAEDLGFNG